jgi:hypothetical protein
MSGFKNFITCGNLVQLAVAIPPESARYSTRSPGSPMTRPAGSFSYWTPDRRRPRIGRYRVMYDITAEAVSGTSAAARPEADPAIP